MIEIKPFDTIPIFFKILDELIGITPKVNGIMPYL